MTSSVQSVEVSYFIQMTEDEGKVKRAVDALLEVEGEEERQEAEGHFGNVIVWVRRHITGDDADAAVKAVVSAIDPEGRKAVLDDLASFTDEHGALYLRLSKQVLVMSHDVVLTSSDPVRVKVKPRAYMLKGDPAGFYGRLFEGAGD